MSRAKKPETPELDGMPARRHDVTLTLTGKVSAFLEELPAPGDEFRGLDFGTPKVHAVEEFAPDDEGHVRWTVKLIVPASVKEDF